MNFRFTATTLWVKLTKHFQNPHRYSSSYTGRKGADILCKTLLEHGVTVINAYPGGRIFPLNSAIGSCTRDRKSTIQVIANSNELNSGFVAEGYARSSGSAGVFLVTSGPGVTNLVTP